MSIYDSMFGDEDNGMEECQAPYPKRTRIPRACNLCQKKKIRCDGKIPCTSCNNYGAECIFTALEKRPPKGAKYIAALEERLGRMEAVLNRSILIAEENNGISQSRSQDGQQGDACHPSILRPASGVATSSGGFSPPPQPQPPPPPRERAIPDHKGAEGTPQAKRRNLAEGREKEMGINDKLSDKAFRDLSDIMCSLATKNCAEPRRNIFSQGPSVFSPEGIKWIDEKTGNHSFKRALDSAVVDSSQMDYWKPDIFSSIFQRPVLRHLPPEPEAKALLKEFFRDFNDMVPLFHESSFMGLVDRHYSRNPCTDIGWWASLNVTIALAYRFRAMSQSNPSRNPEPRYDEDNQRAWDYLKNAVAVLTELSWRSTDLLGVQALLGMVFFMQGYPNPEPMSSLLAVAIRLSHSLGLHCVTTNNISMDPIILEQRKRVFWIAYRLDKDISLRLGRPIVQDDDDMDVELPSENPDDRLGYISLRNQKGKMNLFRVMSEFARIESRVYKQLYSRKALKQSDEDLLYTISELDHQIEEWRESLPAEFQPDFDIDISSTNLVLHLIVLHLSYYNTLNAIHRTSVHHGYWTSKAATHQRRNNRALNPRVFASQSICVSAARASIRLTKRIPLVNNGYIWRVLYYPVSALLTLFSNILQHPTDPHAQSDIRLMNYLIDFLSRLRHEEYAVVKRILGVCSELERIARAVLEKTSQDAQVQRTPKRGFSHSHSEIPKEPQQLQSPFYRQMAPTPVPVPDRANISRSQSRGGMCYNPQHSPLPNLSNEPPNGLSRRSDSTPNKIESGLNTPIPSPSQYSQDFRAFSHEKFDDLLRSSLGAGFPDLYDFSLEVGIPDLMSDIPEGGFI